MELEPVFLFYVTTKDRAAALELGRAVVRERLAACANVLDGVTSIYEWRGELQEEGEALLFLKTTGARRAALEARLLELHGYECPCVVGWRLESGNPDFLRWVDAQTRPG